MTKLHSWRATALIGLALLSSCGGSGDDGQRAVVTTDQGADSPDDSTPTVADPDELPVATADDEVAVGLEADFGGFRYHAIQATLGERFGSLNVAVSVDVENLGAEPASPRFIVSLQTSGEVFERIGGGGPEIAPGATVNDTYEFTVGADFGFDDAVLSIGEEGSAQASIALTGGAVVSLTPIELGIDLAGTAELVEMRLDRVVIDWHSLAVFDESADAGSAFLTAVVDISLGDTSRTAMETFELVLPGGETVTPERAPNEVINADEPAAGLEVAFIVPDPFGGDYVIRLVNLTRFPADTMVEIPFVVGE